MTVGEDDLRLLHHPDWDSVHYHFLRLDGGWRMNFSGVAHSFGRPIRPLSISYAIKIEAGCGVRSFFNLFLSSSEEPYADNANFWAGSRNHPPAPWDVFSVLFDTHASNGRSQPMLWTPSGLNQEFRQGPFTASSGAGFAVGEWHRVVLEFCWRSMEVRCSVNGHAMGPPGPFGPHQLVRLAAAQDPATEEERQLSSAAARAVAAQRGGFRHLYLFTWLEDPQAPDAPNVCIADLWVEGEHEGEVDTLPDHMLQGNGVLDVPADESEEDASEAEVEDEDS